MLMEHLAVPVGVIKEPKTGSANILNKRLVKTKIMNKELRAIIAEMLIWIGGMTALILGLDWVMSL